MANRNRDAGHNFERDMVLRLKESGLFPYAVTARAESRNRDNQKVDIMNTDEGLHGRMPYDFQCKTLSTSLNYPKLIAELPSLPGIMPVILHKQTKKSEGGKFMVKGTYAAMKLDDFWQLMRFRKGFELLYKSATEEQKIELAEFGL